jgi:hypothetical protein
MARMADSTDPDAPDGFSTYEIAYANGHIIGPCCFLNIGGVYV